MSILPESHHAISGESLPGATLILAGLDFAAAAWMIVLYSVVLPRMNDGISLLLFSVLLILALLIISASSLLVGGVRSEPRIVRRVLLSGTIALALVVAVPIALTLGVVLQGH